MRLAVLPLFFLLACSRNPGDEARGEPMEAPPPPAERPATPAREAPSAAEATPFDPARPTVAGLGFEVPAPFEYRRPSQSMRLAEYVVPEAAGERPATMTVHHFAGMGGSVRDNITRWAAQLSKPDGTPVTDPTITERTVAGLPVTLIDASGAYRAMSFGGAPAPLEPNHRLLGAIVAAPGGLVFFKLVGPASTVARAEDAFRRLVDGFHPAP